MTWILSKTLQEENKFDTRGEGRAKEVEIGTCINEEKEDRERKREKGRERERIIYYKWWLFNNWLIDEIAEKINKKKNDFTVHTVE